MTPEQNAHVKTLVDKQEIFDYVVNHLRQQGGPALNFYGDCAYRGGDDTMCAVGCLLADDEYVPGFEGTSAKELELPHRLREHADMLDTLQGFHDLFDNWSFESEGGFSQRGEQRLKTLRAALGIK